MNKKQKVVKKLSNRKQLWLVVGIAIALLIGINVIGVVKAQDSQAVGVDKLIELGKAVGGGDAFIAGLNFLGQGISQAGSEVIGAVGDLNLSSFTTKDIQTKGITIDGPAYFQNTTTEAINTYLGLHAELRLPTASSTIIGDGKDTNIEIFSFTNNGAPITCGLPKISSLTATAVDMMFKSGTTTCEVVSGSTCLEYLSTTTNSLIASTTANSLWLTSKAGDRMWGGPIGSGDGVGVTEVSYGTINSYFQPGSFWGNTTSTDPSKPDSVRNSPYFTIGNGVSFLVSVRVPQATTTWDDVKAWRGSVDADCWTIR